LLGALLAALAAGLLLWPALQQLQRDQQQLNDLKEQVARLPLLRQQLTRLRENLEEAQQKQRRILGLIAGSGDISTFMSQLGREAIKSGVQLDSYEPVTTTPAADPASKPSGQPPAGKPAAADGKAPPPEPVDPLLGPGLQKTSMLITARGRASQLLDFLRRVERLNLLVVQSDLSVTQDAPPSGQKPAEAAVLPTLKLSLALYSKAEKSAAAPLSVAKP
jgi:type IV pilus assembly protein PilO